MPSWGCLTSLYHKQLFVVLGPLYMIPTWNTNNLWFVASGHSFGLVPTLSSFLPGCDHLLLYWRAGSSRVR